MTIGNVSTYTILQTTLTNVTKVEGDLNTEQEQLSSGNKSADFTGLADQTQQFLSLDNILSKTNQYLSDNKVVETRLSATSTALTQIINSATSFQSLLSQRLSGVSNSAAFDTQIQGVWQQLSSQLNTSVNGSFIFSGTKTNTPPVNTATFPTLLSSGVPDTSYYHGSAQDMSARAQDNTVITYNVRADTPGFQNLIAGLVMARQGNANNSSDDLKKAENLVQSGLQSIIGTQATVGATSAQFSSIDTSLSNQKLYWQGIQQSIGSADIASVSTQVAINQGILQAAFQAFAKITSLRLADYLK